MVNFKIKTAPNPPKRTKKLLLLVGIPAGLLVCLYFFLTSSFFIKTIVLPKAGKALNAQITVTDISVSPFSGTSLKGLQVTTTGTPLLTADAASVHYSLMDILGGKLTIHDLKIESPTVTIVEKADGSSNLKPILDALKAGKKSPETEKSKEKSAPTKLNLSNITLENAHFTFDSTSPKAGHQTIDLAKINLNIDQIKTGIAGKLQLSTDVIFEQTLGTTKDRIETRATANYEFTITPDLLPQSVKGSTELKAGKVTGAFSDLAGLASTLNVELTPTELKNLQLAFTQDGNALGALKVAGPLDLVKGEAKLDIDLQALDKRVLNLAGAAMGLDFEQTQISGKSRLEASQDFKTLNISGEFAANQFSVSKQDLHMVPLDLNTSFALQYDKNKKSGQLDSFTLTGTQDKHTLLAANLSKPMKFSTDGKDTDIPQSSLSVKITGLNLADWRPFLGNIAPAGKVNLNLDVVSEKAGKNINVDLATDITGLKVVAATNSFDQLNTTLKLQSTLSDFKTLTIPAFDFALTHQTDPLLNVNGNAKVDLKTKDASGDTTVEAYLVPAIALLKLPNIKAQDGRFKTMLSFKQVVDKGTNSLTLKGNASLTGLTGVFSGIHLKNFQTGVDFSASLLNGNELGLPHLTAAIQHNGSSCGSLDLSGSYSLATSTGKLDYNLLNLNEKLLADVLAPSLKDASLTSVSINSKGSVKLGKVSGSSIKAELQVSRLLVEDKAGKLPKEPLAVVAKLDVAQTPQAISLNEVRLTLTPTDRASNELTVTGNVNTSVTNAITGNIKITSAGLDLTRYYDIFSQTSDKTAQAKTTTTASPAPVSAEPPKEPDPVKLPFKDFHVDLDLKKLYLREVAIVDWQTSLLLNGGQVKINPAKLTLNGAPVSAKVDLDLSLPGYRYDIAANASKVPLAPLANSFAPDYKDRAKGDLNFNMDIKGLGTLGKSLQKNLAGDVSLSFTNANIQLMEKGVLKGSLSTILLVLNMPDLINKPLDHIGANLHFGGGNIEVQNFVVHSSALQVSSKGTIPINEVLTNSPLNQPVTVALEPGIAKNFKIPGKHDTGEYVALPNFVQLKGTLGKPEVKTDKVVITGLLLGGVGGGITGDAGAILKGVGGLLTGKGLQTKDKSDMKSDGKSPDASKTETNKTTIRINPLDFFKKKK